MNHNSILVTGCCGTVGKSLISFLIENTKFSIIGIDINENELFLLSEFYKDNSRISFYNADIRDRNSIKNYFNFTKIIFHLAALKHVGLNESNPSEVINTNINSLMTLIDLSKDYDVDKFIFSSSDKAVNPTNVMGTSKLLGEKIISAANIDSSSKTIFSSVRFGNVLASNGSVLPIFLNQLKNNLPLTITDKRMTRFIMDVTQSVRLLFDSLNYAIGGEVFVTKMPAIRIIDLATSLLNFYNKNNDQLQFVYPKPGEKLYEELISDDEMTRVLELDNYYVIKPAFIDLYPKNKFIYKDIKSKDVSSVYNSENNSKLSEKEIIDFLLSYNLIPKRI